MDSRGRSALFRISSTAVDTTPIQSNVLLVAVFLGMQQSTYLYENLVQLHERNRLS